MHGLRASNPIFPLALRVALASMTLASIVPAPVLLASAAPLAADNAAAGSRTYRVGIDRHLPPFSFVDEHDRPRGSVIELLTEIGKVMELRFVWRIGSQDELRAALAAGEIDLLATAPSSLANETDLVLSESHSFLDDGYFAAAENSAGTAIRSVSSLDGLRVVTVADDPAQDFVHKLSTTAELVVEKNLADALRRLAAGGGDIALLPRPSGTLLMRQLQLSNLRVLPQTVDEYTRTLSFAARRDHADLIQLLDQGLIITTDNGSFLRIYSEWEGYRGESDYDLAKLLWVVAPVVFLLLLSMTWTWLLRREVARRTEDLRRAETEKRAVEARIAQAQKLESLAVLAGGVAHDFNNLLMAMLGNTSLAMLQAEPDAPVRLRLREIEKAGKRAAELCQQMLNYSGRGSFRIEHIDLTALVRTTSDLLESSLPGQARLEYDLASGLPTVDGDSSQLRQVLLNLVTNAAEAMQEEGIITLSTRLSEGEIAPRSDLAERLPLGVYVLLEVRDDGIGMDENIRARIFEPFFTTKFTGRGLGLAATLGIVRGHRGAIQVETHLGDGTVFRIFLPVSPEQPPAADAERAARQMPAVAKAHSE